MNCSVNGCHCPQGMVVNTLINRCVPPQTCPASKLTSILQGNRVHTKFCISNLYIDNKNPYLLYYAKNSNTQHILQNIQIMVKLYHMHMWQHYKDSYSTLTFIFSQNVLLKAKLEGDVPFLRIVHKRVTTEMYLCNVQQTVILLVVIALREWL